MKLPEKCVVIGIDAAVTKAVNKYIKEGSLPNIARLVKNGVWAENCLCPFPTITPPNWTTIVTGATVGTHGITCFHLHKPGDELDRIHQAFDSRECQAEYIWQSAERVGKKSVIIAYPTTWPPTVKEGYQLGGAGGFVNDFRDENTGEWGSVAVAGNDQLFSTDVYPVTTQVEFKEFSEDILSLELPIFYRDTRFKIEPFSLFALAKKSDGKQKLEVYTDKKYEHKITSLEVGKWSETLYETLKIENGTLKVRYKFKLLELSIEERKMKLYRTSFESLKGLCYPESLSEELNDLPGLSLADGYYTAYTLEWIDIDTFLELEDMNNTWIASATATIFKNHPWSLFFMHTHTMDNINHLFMNQIAPYGRQVKEDIDKAIDIERRAYQNIDRMIGRIVESEGERALVIVVSDHGSVSFRSTFRPGPILEKAGLLTYKDVVTKEEETRREIDWSKTRAVPQRASYIYVNLKDRDPKGIVEKDDYEGVCDEIINALYNYTDPETGKKPVAFAFKRKDTRLIGLKGDRVGDIVYGLSSEFGGAIGGVHGSQIPTAESKEGDMRSVLILSGPGIKKGQSLERTVGLEDIVPTICFLMNIPVPAQCEGGIIYQAIEDPDYLQKEIDTLKKNYARLEKAYNIAKAQTHSY